MRALSDGTAEIKVHATLWAKFPNGLPPDDTIKTFLLFEHDPPFNPSSVAEFIRQFRKTIEFAGLETAIKSDENEASERTVPNQPIEERVSPAPLGAKRPLLKVGMTQAVFPLDEGEAVLQMPERFSAESFEDFESWIKLVLKKAKRTILASAPVGSDVDTEN